MSTSSTSNRDGADRWFLCNGHEKWPYILTPTTGFYLETLDHHRRVCGWLHHKDAAVVARNTPVGAYWIIITRAELDAMYAAHKARETLAGLVI